jgi:hypothetical protein
MTQDMMEQHTKQGEIVMYQPDETIRLEVRLENDTVWLTQAQIVPLFQKAKSTISFHISNIFKEGELDEKVIVRKNRTTTIRTGCLVRCDIVEDLRCIFSTTETVAKFAIVQMEGGMRTEGLSPLC